MVSVEGLSIRYPVPGGWAAAVEGACLELPRGGVTAIVGPSGCGKTSLVQALAGLVQPAEGRILIDGRQLTGRRSETAVIFQDYGLLPWKTVEANAELPLRIRGVAKAERQRIAAPLLEELGLEAFRRFYPGRLSGGMKQRLAIARALTSSPDLLLMDEPFSSLDALTRESLQDSLLTIKRRHGMTVLIVTHSVEEAVYLADRVYVMRGRLPGRIAERIDIHRDTVDSREQSAAVHSDAPQGIGEGVPTPAPLGNLTAASVIAKPSDERRNDFRQTPLFHRFATELRTLLREEGLGPRPPERRFQTWASRSLKAIGVRALATIAALFLFLGLWHVAAAALHRPFLPSPDTAFVRLAERAADGSLLRHVGASARRILLAILIVAPPSAILGLAAGRSRRLDAMLSPLIYLFYPLPKIAFLPLIMLLLGLGDASKIGVIVLIVASQVLVNARDAARGIPEGFFDSVKTLGAGWLARIRHVLIPAALPALLSALRVSLGTATAVLFFAETFATEEGLGWYIMDAWARVDYPDMYAAILALSLFGILSFALVDLVEMLTCRWRERQ